MSSVVEADEESEGENEEEDRGGEEGAEVSQARLPWPPTFARPLSHIHRSLLQPPRSPASSIQHELLERVLAAGDEHVERSGSSACSTGGSNKLCSTGGS